MKKIFTIVFAAFLTLWVSDELAASSADVMESAADRKPAKVKGEIKEVTFHVHLHCDNCVNKVRENISFERGVKDLHVCLEDQSVSIKYDASKTSEDALKKAIEELGYEVNGKAENGHVHSH